MGLNPIRTEAVSALINVDMQTGFLIGKYAIPDAALLIESISALLTSARRAQALVVHLQNDGALGATDEPFTPGWPLYFGVEESPFEVVIRKTADDGFQGTLLDMLLQDYGVKRLMVVGLLSEMCVSATARTAMSKGYRVIISKDAHGTYPLAEIPASVVARVSEHALGDALELESRSSNIRFKAAAMQL